MNNEYWLSGQPLHYLKIKRAWLGLEKDQKSVQTTQLQPGMAIDYFNPFEYLGYPEF